MPILPLTSILRRSSCKILALALCHVFTLPIAFSQATGESYFPLNAGAKWEYTGHFSFTGGKPFPVRATMSVNGKILISGKRYFKFVLAADFSGLPAPRKPIKDIRYYRIAEDGIYVRSGEEPNKPELVEIPLPIPIGVKWSSGTAEAWAERAGTIKAGDNEYADCLKISYKAADGARSTEYYLAPGVGVIRAIYTDTNEPKSVMELTLKEYTQ